MLGGHQLPILKCRRNTVAKSTVSVSFNVIGMMKIGGSIFLEGNLASITSTIKVSMPSNPPIHYFWKFILRNNSREDKSPICKSVLQKPSYNKTRSNLNIGMVVQIMAYHGMPL